MLGLQRTPRRRQPRLPPGGDEKAKAALANMKDADEKTSEIIRWRKANVMSKAREALKGLQKSDEDGDRRLTGQLVRKESGI